MQVAIAHSGGLQINVVWRRLPPTTVSVARITKPNARQINLKLFCFSLHNSSCSRSGLLRTVRKLKAAATTTTTAATTNRDGALFANLTNELGVIHFLTCQFRTLAGSDLHKANPFIYKLLARSERLKINQLAWMLESGFVEAHKDLVVVIVVVVAVVAVAVAILLRISLRVTICHGNGQVELAEGERRKVAHD